MVKNNQAKPSNKDKASPKTDDFKPVSIDELDKDLFVRNLAALKRSFGNHLRLLEDVKSTQATLVKNSADEFDIDFRGARLYEMGHLTWAKKRMRNFDRKAGIQKLKLQPPDSTMLDDESNVTVYRMLKRATEEGIEFNQEPQTKDSFHLVCLGAGLCGHLPTLARRTSCQNLVIIEPNIEFLYLSLYVFDWAAFLQKFEREGRHLTIFYDQNAELLAENIRDQVRYIHPSFMEGMTFFKSYQSSLMDRAIDIILRERDLLSVGLGFVEDEMDMVRNSYHNLKDFNGHYFKKGQASLDIPAFIIGSGPSLDDDLAFIRENQANAIIISCGTSIRILLNNGIRPDFHVEIENVPVVADLMEKLAEKFDLSKISLMATTTVDPRVSKHFENVIYYFRSALASYPLFNQGPDSGLTYATPMVTNLGFSFAQEIGARRIYNFGIDLGARNPEKHHADDAPYNAGEIDFDTTIDQPVPGNFGGTVYSEMIYLWAKQTMEVAMKRFSAQSVYYNCSDGVRMEGMVPKLSSAIQMKPRDDKETIVHNIIDTFPRYTKRLFEKSWTDYNARKHMHDMEKRMLSIVKTGRRKTPNGHKKEESYKRPRTKAACYPLRYMMHIVRELIPAQPVVSAEIHYYRGSTFMCMAAVIYYYMRIADEKKRKVFLKIVKEEFMDQIKRINTRVQTFYDTLEPQD